MTPRQKLLAILSVLGVVTLGPTTYVLLTPKPGVTVADMVDAGFLDYCRPAVFSCGVRVAEACRQKADGGLWPAYGRVQTQAGVCDRGDAGNPALVFRWPKGGGGDCFELAGPPDSVCSVDDDCDGGCSWDPSGAQSVTPLQDLCACRTSGAGNCFVPLADGGQQNIPRGITVFPPFSGAGCIRKPCYALAEPADAGDRTWPAGCGP